MESVLTILDQQSILTEIKRNISIVKFIQKKIFFNKLTLKYTSA